MGRVELGRTMKTRIVLYRLSVGTGQKERWERERWEREEVNKKELGLVPPEV
jgi:hypothetical protein